MSVVGSGFHHEIRPVEEPRGERRHNPHDLSAFDDIEATVAVYRVWDDEDGIPAWIADFGWYPDARLFAIAMGQPVSHASENPEECEAPTMTPRDIFEDMRARRRAERERSR